APHDAAHAVRVPAVERVLVVEVEHPRARLLVVLRPEQHRLAPQHARVVVDDPLRHEFVLRGVPQPVAGRGPLELVEIVEVRARIVHVRRHRALYPVGERGELVEVAGADAPVVAEFAPRGDLLHEGLEIGCGGAHIAAPRARLAHDARRGDLAVVQIRRQTRGTLAVTGFVALLIVVAQAVAHEVGEAVLCGHAPA
ncbi:MAG: hypothetical protein ACK55Z_30665, partial [bacterium]